MRKYQILTNKRRFYRIAGLGAGTALAMAAPAAIVIACGTDATEEQTVVAPTRDYAKMLETEANRVSLDLTSSTADSLSWVNAPQVPKGAAEVIDRVEYALGRFDNAPDALAQAAWSSTLPEALPAQPTAGTTSADLKLWVKYVVKPNVPTFATHLPILVNPVYGASFSNFTQVKPAATAIVRNFNSAPLVAEIEKLAYAPGSNRETITWENMPVFTSSQLADVARVDYLIGKYATEAEVAAADSKSWTSSLPSSFFSVSSPGFNLWAKIIAKQGVTLSTTYVDLSTKVNLSLLPSYTDANTSSLQALTDQLDFDADSSTVSFIAWQNALQISANVRPDVVSLEYAFYDVTKYASLEAASVSSEVTLSSQLPFSLPTGLSKANARLLVKYSARAGSPLVSETSNKYKFKNTLIAASKLDTKLAALKDAPTTTPTPVNFDSQALIQRVYEETVINRTSTLSNITWTKIPIISGEDFKNVASIEYIFGQYPTEATLANAKGWVSSLPAGFYTSPGINVWARLTPRPGVTLTHIYTNLTDRVNLDGLLKVTLPTEALKPSGFNYGSSWTGSHQDVVFVSRTDKGLNEPVTDEVNTYAPGIWTLDEDPEWNVLNNSRVLGPVRLVRPKVDQLVYDNTTKQVGKLEADATTRATRVRFTFFDQITLVDESGKETVFDKDFSPNDILSNDPRDINSKNFTDTLFNVDPTTKARIVSMSFKLNANAENTYWKQNITGANGAKLNIKDFLLGLMWSVLSSPRERVGYSGLDYNYAQTATDTTEAKPASGAFKKVTDEIVKAVYGSGKRPKGLMEPSVTTAASDALALESRMGVDVSLFDNPTDPEAIKSMFPDEKTFKLNISADTTLTERRNFWTYFKTERFVALPYEATVGLVTNKVVNGKLEAILRAPVNPVLNDEDWAKFKGSAAYKVGYYHHFLANREDFYTAGPYYLSEAQPKSTTIAIKLNDGFVDQRFNNQKNSTNNSTLVRQYRINYVANSAGTGPLLDQYQKGTNVGGSDEKPLFSYLTGDNQVLARGTLPDGFGVKYSTGLNALSSVWTGFDFSGLTAIPVAQAHFTPQFFNDNFAKLLYGKSGFDLNNEKTLNEDGSVIKSLTSGNGFIFRKLLMAAINAYAMVRRGMPTSRELMHWPSLFGPEETIWGADLDKKFTEENPIILRTVLEDVEKTLANGINEEGLLSNYIFARENAKLKDAGLISRASYIQSYSAATNGINRFGAPSTNQTGNADPLANINPLQVIRAEIKRLLDEVVGELTSEEVSASTVSASKKVTWEMPYSTGGIQDGEYASPLAQETYVSIKAMLERLDPRLNLVALMTPSSLTPPSQPDGNSTYQQATVLMETWPGNITFNVTAREKDPGLIYQDYWFDRRTPYFITDTTAGYNAGAMRAVGKKTEWDFNAPTEAFMFAWGYLQTGVLLFQSYYSDPAEYKNWETPTLKPLHNLTDALKKIFSDFMSNTTLEKLQAIGLSNSTKAQSFVDAIKKLKFEDWWKSNYRKIEAHDYLGMKGLEDIVKLREELITKTNDKATFTGDERLIKPEKGKDDFGYLMDYLNLLYNGTISSLLWAELNKLDTKTLVDTLVAWQAVAPDNMNPLTAKTADRARTTFSLQKVWYFDPGKNGDESRQRIWQKRVDMDHVNNWYLDQPLFEVPKSDPNDQSPKQFKTADEGGVVF